MEPGRQHAAAGGEATLAATAAGTMRAIVQDGYGSADVLRLARIAPPEIAGGEVLVRVHAAGLDRGTWHVMTGRPYLLRLVFGVRAPRSRCRATRSPARSSRSGRRVTRFRVGDEVFGFGRGTFAEYAAAREDKLARKPAEPHLRAGRGGAGVRAHRPAGPDRRRPCPGRAAGARHRRVGRRRQLRRAAGQGARARRSPACAAPRKLDLVRSLGADHVIDYTQRRLRRRRPPLRPDPRHRRKPAPCPGCGARSHPPGPPSSSAARTAAT